MPVLCTNRVASSYSAHGFIGIIGSMPRMSKLQLLLTPSLVSFLVCLLLAGSIIAAASLFGQNGDFLSRTLFGTNAPFVTSTADQFRASAGAFFDYIFRSTLLNKVLFIAFWAVIGLIVYAVIYVFEDAANNAVGFRKKLKYVHADPAEMRRQLIYRIALITIAILLLITYGFLLVAIVLPVSITQVNRTILLQQGPLHLIFAFLLLFAYWHLGVILLRFTLLRPRLLEDPDVQVTA